MPCLSDSMEEEVMVTRPVEDVSAVTTGNELAEIETDKATMTCEADEDGFAQTVAKAGGTLPVGTPIASPPEPARSRSPVARRGNLSPPPGPDVTRRGAPSQQLPAAPGRVYHAGWRSAGVARGISSRSPAARARVS